jgi:hypothetical protein
MKAKWQRKWRNESGENEKQNGINNGESVINIWRQWKRKWQWIESANHEEISQLIMANGENHNGVSEMARK